jgi:hypothetical protein
MLSVLPLPRPVDVLPGPIRTETIINLSRGEPTTDLRHCGIWFVLGTADRFWHRVQQTLTPLAEMW